MDNEVNREAYSYNRFNQLSKHSKTNFYLAITHWFRIYKEIYVISMPFSTQKKGGERRDVPKYHWSTRRLGTLGWWREDYDEFKDYFTDQSRDKEDGLTFPQEFWVNMLEKNRNYISSLLCFYIFYLAMCITFKRADADELSRQAEMGHFQGYSLLRSEHDDILAKQMRAALVVVVIFTLLIGTLAEFQHSSSNYQKMKHCLRRYRALGIFMCLYKMAELTVQVYYFAKEYRKRKCSDIDYNEDLSATFSSIRMLLSDIGFTCENFIFAVIPVPVFWYLPCIGMVTSASLFLHAFHCLAQINPYIQRMLLCIGLLSPVCLIFLTLWFVDSEINTFYLTRAIHNIERIKNQNFDFVSEIRGKLQQHNIPTTQKNAIKKSPSIIVRNMDAASRWRQAAAGKVAAVSASESFASSRSEMEIYIQGFKYLQDNEITKLSWLLDEVALAYKFEDNLFPPVAYTTVISHREVLLDLFTSSWLQVFLLGDPMLDDSVDQISARMVIAKEATLGEKIRIVTEGGEGGEEAEVRMVLLGGIVEVTFAAVKEECVQYGDTSLIALALKGLFRYLRRVCEELRVTYTKVAVKVRVGIKSLEQLSEEDPLLFESEMSRNGGPTNPGTTNSTKNSTRFPIHGHGDLQIGAKHFLSIELALTPPAGVELSEPPLHTALVSFNCMLLCTWTGGYSYYVEADNSAVVYFHFGVSASCSERIQEETSAPPLSQPLSVHKNKKVRVCIMVSNIIIQDYLSSLCSAAGEGCVVVVRSHPRDIKAEGMQTDFVEVFVVNDKDLCIVLRKSGFDGLMILHSDQGMYLEKHYSDLVDLVLDAPITVSTTLDMKNWFSRVVDRDPTVRRWKCRRKGKLQVNVPTHDPTVRENISPPLKKSFREVWMYCTQIVDVPVRAIATVVYVINKIIRAIQEISLKHVAKNDELIAPSDYTSQVPVDRRTFAKYYVYHNPYVVSENDFASEVKISPILSARFAFIKGSEWWAGGSLAADQPSVWLSLSLIKTVFQRIAPTSLALQFNDSLVHGSYTKWVGGGKTPSIELRKSGTTMVALLGTMYLMAVPIVSTEFNIYLGIALLTLATGVWNRHKLLAFMHRLFGVTLETYKWPLLFCFVYDFYHMALILGYMSGLAGSLPSALHDLVSKESIHSQLKERGTNYVLIVFIYFMAMRLALPNPTSVFFWFGLFIYVRAVLVLKIFYDEILYEILTGEDSTPDNGPYTLFSAMISMNFLLPCGILCYFSYKHARQVQIEFQLWRIGYLRVLLLKNATKHISDATATKLLAINSMHKTVNKLSYKRMVLGTQKCKFMSKFFEEAPGLQNLHAYLENVCVALQTSSAIKCLDVETKRHANNDTPSRQYEFSVVYPMKQVLQWCGPFCYYVQNNIPDISITIETEAALSCIRVEADLLKLLVVRALSSICTRHGSSQKAENKALTVAIRISSIETHIKLRPQDEGRILCDDDGNMRYDDIGEEVDKAPGASMGVGSDSLKKMLQQRTHNQRSFYSKRKLVLEVIDQNEEPWVEKVQDRNGTNDFLWYALKVAMNQDRTHNGNTAEICIAIPEPKFERTRFLFTLNYQKVPSTMFGRRNASVPLNPLSLFYSSAISSQKLHTKYLQENLEMQSGTKQATKTQRISKKQDLRTEIITMGADSVLPYVMLFTDFGWKVNVSDAVRVLEGETVIQQLYQADIVMIFYNSDEELSSQSRGDVSAKIVLERLMMIGITAVIVGINMSSHLVSSVHESTLASDVLDESFPSKFSGHSERHFDLMLSSRDLLQTDSPAHLLYLVRMIALKKLMAIED